MRKSVQKGGTVALDKAKLLERIQSEKTTPTHDERVSIRLTKETMLRLQELGKKTGIAYTRLAAIFVEEGVLSLAR